LEKPLISNSWHKDIPAGVVVFLVALPLCIGIAMASGAPPIAGLISGVIGGLIVGILSGSEIAVSGPAAGLILILGDATDTMGSFEMLLPAILLSGVIQLAIGYLKGGIFGEYFPSAVIKGMLAAIGITLVINQIPHAVGYDSISYIEDSLIARSHTNIFIDLVAAFNYISYGAVIIFSVAMLVLLLWEIQNIKNSLIGRVLPGELVAVALGIIINQIFISNGSALALDGDHLVILPNIFGVSTDFSSLMTFPDMSAFKMYDTYLIAFLIAGVASLETLLSVDASDKLDPYKRYTDKNRELKAQGVGNMLCGLVGGIPMTAVIVRSSANLNAGGRTRLSTIVHGFLLVASVLLIPSALNMIPLACLAAILIKIGYKLARVGLFREMYRAGKPRFINFMITIVAILLTDLLIGIIIGVIVAIFLILKENYRSDYKIKRRLVSDGVSEREEIEICLSENLTILNKASLHKMFSELPEGSMVILNGESTRSIDYDTSQLIKDFSETAAIRGIDLYVIGLDSLDIQAEQRKLKPVDQT
jgi:MFS superfamily sulfate permease-like transporter